MARVITFSRQFPEYHPKKGQPTYFIEKFLKQQGIDYLSFNYLVALQKLNPGKSVRLLKYFWESLRQNNEEKHHTIRAGHRWNAGDKFSPRAWSGKPYNSPQIIFSPDIQIAKTWNSEIDEYKIHVDGKLFYEQHASLWHDNIEKLASNDGLSCTDLYAWFKMPTQFKGQIICWNPEVTY